MNLQQLQYIIAVDTFRHFGRAADACFVTQPTLSMMIQKLEDEYDIQLFDRSRQPVIPTEAGVILVNQAKAILREAERFGEMVKESKNLTSGELRIGVIPTIAPYLLPLFLREFHEKYPSVQLKITEAITDVVVEKLTNGQLDAGILVMPENRKDLKASELYNEAFVVYSPKSYDKEYLLAEDLDPNELLLLEEGHCFRSQIMQFCELRDSQANAIEYTSGSLETLRQLADKYLGITILPEMAILSLTEEQRNKIKRFVSPQPQRQVSLITHRHFVKERLIKILHESIISSVETQFGKKETGEVIGFLG